MTTRFNLFSRVPYVLGKRSVTKKFVMKGEKIKPPTSKEVKDYMKMCNVRAKYFRLAYLFMMSLAACMNPFIATLTDKNHRYIAAGGAIFLIFTSNLFSWAQYSEKLHAISKQLQDIDDCITLGEKLTEHQLLVFNRILAFIGSSELHSDKSYKNRKLVRQNPVRFDPIMQKERNSESSVILNGNRLEIKIMRERMKRENEENSKTDLRDDGSYIYDTEKASEYRKLVLSKRREPIRVVKTKVRPPNKLKIYEDKEYDKTNDVLEPTKSFDEEDRKNEEEGFIKENEEKNNRNELSEKLLRLSKMVSIISETK